MKGRIAILVQEKFGHLPFLEDLRNCGIREHDAFLCWEEMWLSEQRRKYKLILIDYHFFEMLRDDIVCYHLFHQYKYKIVFYSNISGKISTQKGNMSVDLYRIFFRPFVDFNDLIENNENDNFPMGPRDSVLARNKEKKCVSCRKDAFFLKEGYSLIKFHLDEVLCFESERNYISIYVDSKKHLIRQTLQSTMEVLPDKFYRINRSVVINIDKINKIVGNRVYIDGLNSFRPAISNRYKQNILNAVPLFNETIP